MSDTIIELTNATKIFKGGASRKQWTVALENVNLRVDRGEALIQTIAGESGSGKTTLANLVLGFLKPSAGDILYNGRSLTHGGRAQQLSFRRDVQVVFQDPFAVYNPFYTINHVFNSVIRNLSITAIKAEARELIHDSLRVVGLDPFEVLDKYPHEFSGGQLQRIMIARAFMVRPKVIVADEPVSMIDASLRAKLLDVLMGLKEDYGISFLYITHDLSTAYHIGDTIIILYKGSIVESGKVDTVMTEPKHPYVRLLLDSIPLPDPSNPWAEDDALLSGKNLEETEDLSILEGCKYRLRCPFAMDVCTETFPPFFPVTEGHQVACYLHQS